MDAAKIKAGRARIDREIAAHRRDIKRLQAEYKALGKMPRGKPKEHRSNAPMTAASRRAANAAYRELRLYLLDHPRKNVPATFTRAAIRRACKAHPNANPITVARYIKSKPPHVRIRSSESLRRYSAK